MPSIHLSSVSFSYSSARPLLEGVDLHLGDGWHGVVGPNGAGKSTLLALIAGELKPASGSVAVDSRIEPAVCWQRIDDPGPFVASWATSWDAEDFALRGRLGLEPEQLDRWSTLSAGERKRWQVGGALASRPDVLLLDEPTNHLDRRSRRLLQAALRSHGGLGLVVSHDRDLLDDLTSSTIRVEGGGVTQWGAPYTTALMEWTTGERLALEAEAVERRRLAAVERRLAQRREDLERRRAGFQRTMRQAGAKDHDLHSTARKEKRRKGEAAASGTLSGLSAERDRLADRTGARPRRRTVGRSVELAGGGAPRPILVRLSGPLMAGDRLLVEDLDAAIGRTDRIHLLGDNGAGKSTLLTRIARTWDLAADRMLHLRQESTREEGRQLLDDVRALPGDRRGRVLQLVAALGVDPEALLASDEPSPGEARKLALALGMGTEAWLLLLDEPTNHLDLPAVERLEEALAGYAGALVVVSHDERFARAVAEDLWALESGRLDRITDV